MGAFATDSGMEEGGRAEGGKIEAKGRGGAFVTMVIECPCCNSSVESAATRVACCVEEKFSEWGV